MKIICIGRNYSEHIKELNNETPEEPVIFIKPDTALLRNNNPFFIPDFSQDVHAISQFIPLEALNNETSQGIRAAQFHLEKNGEIVQSGNTCQMIHSVDEIIAHVSEYFSLRIGDFIFTGTPAGVGPVKSGDRLKGFLAGQEMFNFVVK